jgi:serine/threonine protein kinase
MIMIEHLESINDLSGFIFDSIISNKNNISIHRVTKKSDGITYALKMIMIDPTIWTNKAILREIFIMNRINHPNIVKVYDTFIAHIDGCKYICILLDYYTNTLSDICFEKKMTHKDALSVFLQIFDALLYLNSLGFCHCDLSFENIMFDAKGGAKIIDFGSCQLNRTVDYNFLPTIFVMPPELFVKKEKENVNIEKIDVWALGIIYHFILTGETLVYNKFSNYEEYFEQLMDAIKDTTNFDKKTGNKKDFIRLLLSWNPDKRPTLLEVCKILIQMNIDEMYKTKFEKYILLNFDKKELLFDDDELMEADRNLKIGFDRLIVWLSIKHKKQLFGCLGADIDINLTIFMFVMHNIVRCTTIDLCELIKIFTYDTKNISNDYILKQILSILMNKIDI